MAGSDSCIQHPGSDDFLVIRQSYVRMFGGDHCLAALVAVFEFLTNGEITQFKKRGETVGIPWVQIGMPEIERWMVGLFSRRMIQDRLPVLDRLEILKSAGQAGRAAKSYLLNIAGLNTLIAQDFRFDEASIGNFADRNPTDSIGKKDASIGKSADRTTPLKFLGIKELRKEEEQHDIPAAPQEAETKNQHNPGPTLDYAIDEDGETRDQPKFKPRSRLPGKKAKDPNHFHMLPRPARIAPEMTDSASAYTPPQPTSAPAAPIEPAASQPSRTALPEEAEVWNEVVVLGGRVELFNWEMPEGQNLDRCRRNVGFSGITWRRVCEKTQAILACGNEKTGFLSSFFWLTKADKNWWGVLSGQYDHLGAPPRAAKKPETNSALILLEQRRAARAKAQANQTP